jgi:Tfp pilus assembly protein PilO
MEQIKRFRVPLLTGVGTLVLALIVYSVWISPEGTHLKTLQAQETTLQGQQTHLQVEIASLRREKSQLGAKCAQLTTNLTEVPGTPNVDTFFQQVTALAVSSGNPNTPTINVTQSGGSADGVTPVAVSMTLTGTYGQMSAFLQGLDSFPRLLTVTSVSVAGGPVASGGQAVAPSTAGYTLTLSGDIFYSTGQKNVCTST